MSEQNGTDNSTTPVIETPVEDQSLLGLTASTENQTPTEEPGSTENKPEDKPAEQAEAPVPLTVEDIVLPEGFTADESLQTEFVELMNNTELSPKDRANALVALQAKAITAASEASSAAWTEMQDQWRGEVKADLGDKLEPTLSAVGKLITEYGSPELVGVFDLTGAGNNLHVIKFLSTIASKLTEGGYTSGMPAATETTAAERMFPSMKGNTQ